jgi:4'-phosphopantetheinyl transferase
MVKIYIMDINQLNEDSFFEKSLGQVSMERQKKVLAAKNRADKNRNLGAGMVLAYGLQQYGIDEQTITLQYGENGKPYLADIPEIQFNLSHSGDYAVAVFSSLEVGIDIEHTSNNGKKIAKRFFTSKEAKAIHNCHSKEAEDELFLRYWTLKESFLKVTGYGLKLPMDEFEFELQDTVQVKWKSEGQKYFFKEYEIRKQCDIIAHENERYKERYRIAVCAMERDFAPKLTWIM